MGSRIVALIPDSVIAWADSRSQTFRDYKKVGHPQEPFTQDVCTRKQKNAYVSQISNQHIAEAKRNRSDENSRGKSKERDRRPSLFRYLLNSDMPESELSVNRLSKEAQVLLGAGTVSTARTLDFIFYYVTANESVRERLSNDLKDIMAQYPEKLPPFTQLEKIPYLAAVIKEGLRCVFLFCRKASKFDLTTYPDAVSAMASCTGFPGAYQRAHCNTSSGSSHQV